MKRNLVLVGSKEEFERIVEEGVGETVGEDGGS